MNAIIPAKFEKLLVRIQNRSKIFSSNIKEHELNCKKNYSLRYVTHVIFFNQNIIQEYFYEFIEKYYYGVYFNLNVLHTSRLSVSHQIYLFIF